MTNQTMSQRADTWKVVPLNGESHSRITNVVYCSDMTAGPYDCRAMQLCYIMSDLSFILLSLSLSACRGVMQQ